MSTFIPSDSVPKKDSAFAATRWTLVLRSQGGTPEAKAALGELCEAYYTPVLRFLRSEGRTEDTAQELAQEFFSQILDRGAFENADPERGRFRSYLLGALKHFLADTRKKNQRLKRGGTAEHESIHAENESGSEALQIADEAITSPDRHFDREWALQVMDRALNTLESEFKNQGRSNQFDTLKPWLVGESDTLSQASAGLALGLSEGAVKVLIHRMRKRFRDAVRNEIGETLREPALLDEELQHLIQALS